MCIVVDRFDLVIGQDILEFTEEMIKRVELRRLFGQPQQRDVEVFSTLHHTPTGMTGGGIEHKRDGTPAIASAQFLKEGEEVLDSGPLPHYGDTMTAAEVERDKEHTSVIASADRHLGLFSDRTPRCSQRWVEPNGRLITAEHHSLAGEALQAPYESPFFCARCGTGSRKT